jgi:hypothetical protein
LQTITHRIERLDDAASTQFLSSEAPGKTGKRVAQRLEDRGIPVRHGSRSPAIPFDWENPQTPAPARAGLGSVYITYSPDLAVPRRSTRCRR